MRFFINQKGNPEEITSPFPLRGALTEQDDINTITKSGIYIINNSKPQNAPDDVFNHGTWATLVVFHHDDNQIQQTWITGVHVLRRWITENNSAGIEWHDDFQVLQDQIDQLKSKIGGGN